MGTIEPRYNLRSPMVYTDKDQVTEPKTFSATYAVAAGQAVLPAIATKKYLITSMVINLNVSTGIVIKSGANQVFAMTNAAGIATFIMPYNESGWIRSVNINEALTIDVTTASATINLTYFVYTP